MTLSTMEQFVADMNAVGASKTYDQFYEKGFVDLSLEIGRQGEQEYVRVDGYHRMSFVVPGNQDALAQVVAEEDAYAAKRVAINNTLAQLIIDEYKDAPFDLKLSCRGVNTRIEVHIRPQSVELSLRDSPIFKESHLLTVHLRLMENGEFVISAKQGRVRRSRKLIFTYDPTVETERFLGEVLPWLAQEHEGVLRKVSVSYSHPMSGEHQLRTEWYEVYPGDEVDKVILSFKNCKCLMVDSLTIKQVVARDLFGVVKGLYDYHLTKDITETVFAFRLPDDFEPNGREFAETSMVAPFLVG